MNILDIGGGFSGSEFQLKQVHVVFVVLIYLFISVNVIQTFYFMSVCSGTFGHQALAGSLFSLRIWSERHCWTRKFLCVFLLHSGCQCYWQKSRIPGSPYQHSRWVPSYLIYSAQHKSHFKNEYFYTFFSTFLDNTF